MRIISGEHRGRKLFAPEGDETRPTSDRVKEALFNIISARVYGSVVLDMFSGSGALALEALSRGAEYAVLCDMSPKACAVISRNIEGCRMENRAKLIRGDCIAALSRLDRQFDLVFMDPPYRLHDIYCKALTELKRTDRLKNDALIVMEHEAAFDLTAVPEGFAVTDKRNYKDTCITFCTYTKKED